MKVEVLGVRQTLKDLNAFQPNLTKEIRKEITTAAGLVRSKARGFVPAESPMSGWQQGSSQTGRWAARGYDAGIIKSGIKTKRGVTRQNQGNYAYEIRVVNDSAPGLIYEGAGTKHPNGEDTTHGNRGKRFVDNIAKTGLRIPLHRLLVRAGVEVGPQARAMYDRAIERAERELQRKVS